VQNAAAALFPAAEVNTGGSRALQCADFTVTRAAEAWSNVHGH